MPGPGLATNETSVRVAVRVRPLLGKEIVEKCRECVTVDNVKRQIVIGKNRGFTFDYTFNQSTEQEHIYETSVTQLVDSIFQGYNATVFAYGQTGSGKTHTMGTSQSTTMHTDDAGIIPRVIGAIFERIEKKKDEADFMLRCSYLEIYNEAVKDLLNPSTDIKSISIREDDKKGIVVVGVKEEVVTSFEDMMRCLQTGALYRTTGKTLMNEESSRSHSIFTVIVEQRVREGNSSEEYIMAKFHLVDLAGSERNKRTGAVGLRFKESVQINSGLLALGNVISALGDDKKRAHVSHVPYRESKLTRLLQDSLGGNSNTLMIACISPADVNFEETLNTLKYANRARNIKNTPIINRDPHAAQLAHLRSQIQTLQLELLKHRVESDENGEPAGEHTLEELLKNEKNLKYLEELNNKTVTGFGGDLTTRIQNNVVNNAGNAELSITREQNQSLKTETRALRELTDRDQKTISELSEDLFLLQSERDKLQQRKREFCSEIIQTAASMREIENRTSDPQRRPLNEMINKIDHLAKRERFELDKSNRRVNDALKTSSSSSSSSSLLSTGITMQGRPSTAADFRSASSVNHFSSLESSPRTTTIGTSRMPPNALDVISSSPVSLTTIQRLQNELKEAKDDLSRDEKIFAEKFREIKSLSKMNNALKKDLDTLRSTLSDETRRSGQLQDCARQAIQIGSLPDDLSSRFLMLIDDPLPLPLAQGTPMRETSTTSTPRTTASQPSLDIRNDNDNERTDDGTAYDTQEIEEVQAGLHQLELEKQRIEQEKVKIEKRKQTFEAQANEYQHFHAEQKKMEKTLKDLTVMIRLKEELIKDLVKSEHESRVIKQQYEQKIHEMESEMRATHAELEKVLKELENADMEQVKKENEKQRIKNEYEAKLKKKETELADLKMKELESKRLVKIKAKCEKRIKELEQEIGKLKTQHDFLRRRMREDSDRQSEANEEKMRQISSLKREAESNYKRIRDLESENQKQRSTLRKKMEQLERQKYQRLKSPPLHMGSPISTARKQITEEIDKQKAWLDREIEKYLNKKDVMEHLEKELRRREAIIQEKESMITKRQDLERRRLRTSQVMHQSIAGLNRQIDLLDDEIRRKESAIDLHQQHQKHHQKQHQKHHQKQQDMQFYNPHESQSSLEVPNNDQDELDLLLRKKERAQQQKHKLEQKAKYQQVREEEVMRELEERTDVLEAEIEYKNEAIESAQREISGSVNADGNGEDEIDRIGEQLTSLDDAKDMLRKYFDKVIELKEAEREKNTRVMELNVFLGERDKIIDNLQNNIRLTEQVYERRLTKQQKENELKIQYLMKQIQSLESPKSDRDGSNGSGGDSYHTSAAVAAAAAAAVSPASSSPSSSGAKQDDRHVQSMEREVQYYKRTNRDLKQKLREFKSIAQQQRRQIYALQREQVPQNSNSNQDHPNYQQPLPLGHQQQQQQRNALSREREESDDSLVIIDEEQLTSDRQGGSNDSYGNQSNTSSLMGNHQMQGHRDNRTVKSRRELTEVSEEEVMRRKKQIQEKLEKQQAYQRQWMQEVHEQQLREQQEHQRFGFASPRRNAPPSPDDVIITVECDDDDDGDDDDVQSNRDIFSANAKET